MEAAEQLFASIDTNQNGTLEKSEVRAFSIGMLERVKPDATFDEEKFEQNFQAMDKNSDGTVSKQELLDSLKDKARQAGAL